MAGVQSLPSDKENGSSCSHDAVTSVVDKTYDYMYGPYRGTKSPALLHRVRNILRDLDARSQEEAFEKVFAACDDIEAQRLQDLQQIQKEARARDIGIALQCFFMQLVMDETNDLHVRIRFLGLNNIYKYMVNEESHVQRRAARAAGKSKRTIFRMFQWTKPTAVDSGWRDTFIEATGRVGHSLPLTQLMLKELFLHAESLTLKGPQEAISMAGNKDNTVEKQAGACAMLSSTAADVTKAASSKAPLKFEKKAIAAVDCHATLATATDNITKDGTNFSMEQMRSDELPISAPAPEVESAAATSMERFKKQVLEGPSVEITGDEDAGGQPVVLKKQKSLKNKLLGRSSLQSVKSVEEASLLHDKDDNALV